MSWAGRGGWSRGAQAAKGPTLAAPPGPDPLAYPIETVISNLQPGHGFTKGSLGTVADDPADFVRGSQSLRITTDGAAGVVTVTKSAITPAIDLTGRYLRLWLKVDDLAKLAELSPISRPTTSPPRGGSSTSAPPAPARPTVSSRTGSGAS